ncbi:ICOS ligand isoform X3 [Suricata suricatta]|uniref:ICOS ligand n=1 Tax=Suricata suricatta TaxID=37032 RepID=A0A673T2U9_SURSU|nr:ICOS ligand isoform X3 [Suricata suricatta]
MRLRSPGILLLLFSALQATDVQETEVRVLVGGDAELSCAFPRGHTFDLNDLYVYWQISVGGGPKTVVTYYLSGNDSAGHEDNHYRDRARLSLESMTRGDFSLRLYNITPQDEQRFHCLVFRKSLEMKKILDVVVTLHVAANYSMPEVTAPSSPSEDEELTFTCTSMNGYPRPNVFWINRTDNSVLDAALQNNTVYLNAQGLYNVVSVLTVRRTPSVNVGCCIENVLLHQNLTATTPPAETHNGTEDGITESQADAPKKQGAVLSTLLVLGVVVVVAVATGWVCRSRCHPWDPHRSQAARSEHTFFDRV